MREAHVAVDDSEYEAMGIAELVALCEEADQYDFEELACHGNGAVVRVGVRRRLEEERLSSLEAVDNWDYVAETEEGHVYVIAFTAPEIPASVADRVGELVGTCDPELDERGATMSLIGPQEAIADALEAYEDAGVSPDLRRLGTYDGRRDPLEELTDRQEEVIRTAYDAGYYEVPREASTEEVAAELEVDSSTVAEHLQRAERNLLGQFL